MCITWFVLGQATNGRPPLVLHQGTTSYGPQISECSIFFPILKNDVFKDMLNHFLIVFIDDILIYSKSYTEHVTHVTKVLCRLLEHRLYMKAEKCEFHKTEITFLDYCIGGKHGKG